MTTRKISGAPDDPAERNAQLRAHRAKDERFQMLWAHPEFKRAMQLIEGKQRTDGDWLELDLLLPTFVIWANKEPGVHERMTGSERKKLANRILSATNELRECLDPFDHESLGLQWPFQPYLHGLALQMGAEDQDVFQEDGETRELFEHRACYSIYNFTMKHLEQLFDALDDGANHLVEGQTVLKKPNDPNAKRLYFLRKLTYHMNREFGSPCRSATLCLASIYFDCTDLDEADLSKLAPVNDFPSPLTLKLKFPTKTE